MKKILIFYLSILFLISSCNKEGSTTTTPNTLQNITPVLIAEGGNSSSEYLDNISSISNIIIDNDKDWSNFMSKMDNPNGLSMTFSETNIDFNSFTILAVFDQPRTTGGYMITIASIIENKNNIVVSVDYLGNGDATQRPTHPYYIVKIPIIDKPIIFK